MSPRPSTNATRSPEPPPVSRAAAARTLVKGIGALLLVLGFVAGVPYVLVRIDAFPSSVPDPGAVWRAAIGPDLSGRAVFTVLAALVWLGWAWFTLSVLRETFAAIASRGRRPARTPRRMSWSVQPAAILVAAIVAIFVSTPLLAAGAPPALAANGHTGTDTGHRPGTVATAVHTPSPSVEHTGAGTGPASATSETARATDQRATATTKTAKATGSTEASTTTYMVRRYDTLWLIAQKQLGDPMRYREIVDLNPHLRHDPTIHSGQVLTLPHHSGQAATATAPAPAPVASTGATGSVGHVIVQKGDTLSEISAEHGVRDWHAVWAANKVKTEPGGKRFTNPDHIEVGWDINVPTTANTKAADGTPAVTPAASANTTTPDTLTPEGESTQPATAHPAPAPAHAVPDQSAAVGADHRHSPLEEMTGQPPAPPAPVPVSVPAPQPAQAQGASSPQQQNSQSRPAAQGDPAHEPALATVAGYVAGGSVLAAGIYGALVLVRRQQFRSRRPGRTVASTPERLIPVERAIVAAGAPSTDETARIDEVLRRVAATDVKVLHVAAVQLSAGDITVHLSEPAAMPAPWRQGDGSPEGTSRDAGEGVVWTFPAGLDPQDAGADPSVVGAIAPFPTLVHIGSDATSAWLLNLEQTGALVLTGDQDRCLALARVISAQLGVNAWADLVAVTMLGFGQELVEAAPTRLRHAPADAADAVLAAAAVDATRTADIADEIGLAVVEARRSAANDEAWPVHVLLTTTAAVAAVSSGRTAGSDEPPSASPSRLEELLAVVRDRAGATGAAVVVVDEHRLGENPLGATVAYLDAGGTLTLPEAGLTVQATGWDEDTSRGVGMLLAHLRSAPDQSVPDARGDQPWQQLADAAGALRADLVQPRATSAVHDSSRPAGATTLPLADQVYVDAAATTAEDLQVLAPTVNAEVVERVMAADPGLDDDVTAWFDQDSPRAKLAVLGPLTLTTHRPAPRRAYYAELAAYLAFRQHGATAEEVLTAFSLSEATSRSYLSTLRDMLGIDPLTGRHYMPSAKTTAAAKARGVGVYQIDGLLLDADLFRRLRVRGQARGPAGLEDYATALRLVTGPPFSQMRDDGGDWILQGDRIDHHLSLAVVDVAHLLTTSALATGDTASARAAVDIARLAAPDEEGPRLDAAAVDVAQGRGAEARRTIREQVCNRSDDGEPPMDLNPRTRQILAQHRDWLSRAS